MSCAGTYIHVWSINGNPIASANTFTGRSQQILCCCVSEMNEWDTQNVIITGHSDGVVRVTASSHPIMKCIAVHLPRIDVSITWDFNKRLCLVVLENGVSASPRNPCTRASRAP